MCGIRIEYDDNAYNVMVGANKLLKDQNLEYEFKFDSKEHDGFDILTLVKKEE